jgi:hypothetical protein
MRAVLLGLFDLSVRTTVARSRGCRVRLSRHILPCGPVFHDRHSRPVRSQSISLPEGKQNS